MDSTGIAADLASLPCGACFTVKGVVLRGEIGKRLAEMGFCAGMEGKILRKAVLGGPIEIRLMDYLLSIRKEEARGIHVEGDPR